MFGLNSSLKSSLSKLGKKRKKKLNKTKRYVENLIASKGNTSKINKTKINTTKINNETKTNNSILGSKKEDIIKDLLELKKYSQK